MIHTSGNYSFRDPPFKDGDTVTGGNYAQLAPGTEICRGVKDLTITGGNFTNCKAQPSWDVRGGNWTQVSRCSHVHPAWVAKGLAECPADCKHRSPAPVVRTLDEDEVRRRKQGDVALPDLASEQVADQDGVPVLKHTVREYVYADKPLVAREVAHG